MSDKTTQRSQYRRRTQLFSEFDAPMVEVFGGTLALLIVVFILLNIIVTQDIQAMLDRSTEGAEYKVSWQDGSEGMVVISYPDKMRILETNETVPGEDVCLPQAAFLRYAERIYNSGEPQQIIFAITENSVTTTATARNCLREHFPDRTLSIGWIIASRDLLSTVRLDELPARIKRTINPDNPSNSP
ncbi:MAG: hypothetical protein ACR2PR_03545 [Pseudohongiellaceae bacterium]